MNAVNESQKSKVVLKMLEDSPIARSLINDVRWAWIWLILRIYVGWELLHASRGKINNLSWIGNKSGSVLTILYSGALTQTSSPIIAYPARI